MHKMRVQKDYAQKEIRLMEDKQDIRQGIRSLRLYQPVEEKPWGFEQIMIGHDSCRYTASATNIRDALLFDLGELVLTDSACFLGPYHASILGESSDLFPVMVKELLIQKGEQLSFQVHPTYCFTRSHYDDCSYQKDEVWIVLDADADAEFYSGLRLKGSVVDYGAISMLAASGTMRKLAYVSKPQRGDMYFIPAGTLHGARGYMRVLGLSPNVDRTMRAHDDYGRATHLVEHPDAVETLLPAVRIPRCVDARYKNYGRSLSTPFRVGTYISDQMRLPNETEPVWWGRHGEPIAFGLLYCESECWLEGLKFIAGMHVLPHDLVGKMFKTTTPFQYGQPGLRDLLCVASVSERTLSDSSYMLKQQTHYREKGTPF